MVTQSQTKSTFFDKEVLKNSTILYVESDDINRKKTVDIFEQLFKKICSAENGKAGFDSYNINQKNIDIIFVAINIPYSDSIDFMKEVRRVNSSIPIIILTEFDDRELLIKSIKLKVTDYIIKPMQLNTTLKIIYKILQSVYDNNLLEKQKQELIIYKDILDQENLVTKTDLKGIITYANENFCEVSGYTQKEVIGQNHNIIRHPDVSPKIYQELWEKIRNKEIWTGSIKNRAKNGSAYYVKSTIFPILDNDGNIKEYVASRFLITKQEKEKHKLKKYILNQKSYQLKYEKDLKEQYLNAVVSAKVEITEQVSKFINDLKDQILILRDKDAISKSRSIFLDSELKACMNKIDELQIGYQNKIIKLYNMEKNASIDAQRYKNKNIILSEKLEKFQTAIGTLQSYIDEYRLKIKDLEDVIAAYEKQYGIMTL
jgi:PAS domain S-box-containing protein